MKKLYPLLCVLFLVLFTSIGLSIGERKEGQDFTIQKVGSFDIIVGWIKVNESWKSSKNKIPVWDTVKDTDSNVETEVNGNYNIQKISHYEIKDDPSISILTIHFNDGRYKYSHLEQEWENFLSMRVLIVKKSELKNKLTFISEKLDRITLNIFTTYNGEEDFLSLKTDDEIINIIKNILFKYFKDDKSEFEREYHYRKLFIDYYQYNDLIQYFLSSDQGGGLWDIIYGENWYLNKFDKILNRNKIDEKIFRDKYFESPFEKFKTFFNNITHNYDGPNDDTLKYVRESEEISKSNRKDLENYFVENVHKMGERVYVIINGQRFSEGDRINSFVIESIYNEKVIFLHGDIRFIKSVGK